MSVTKAALEELAASIKADLAQADSHVYLASFLDAASGHRLDPGPANALT